MISIRILTALLAAGLSLAAAQTPIRVLRFENNLGLIDRGAEGGIQVGDVFEVNRQSGELMYWVGRVEVIKVNPRFATVKVLVKADNTTIQKGDVLEARTGEYDPMLEKLKGTRDRTPPGGEKAKALSGERRAPVWPPLRFSLLSGLNQSLKSSSASYGLSFKLEVVDANEQPVQTIDMTAAFARSAVLEGLFLLPLSPRWGLNLNYAYSPLRLKGPIAQQLLNLGLQSSAALIKVGAGLDYQVHPRWTLGLGLGWFLPQIKITGASRTATLTDRRWGAAAHLTQQLPLGERIWLQSRLQYHAFLDEGPAIQYLTFQIGPSFAMGRR